MEKNACGIISYAGLMRDALLAQAKAAFAQAQPPVSGRFDAFLPLFPVELVQNMDVLHLCGRGNLDENLKATPGYCQLEFLGDEMPDALAAADIVLSRAGSNTLSELLALGKPMLLVPYPLGASRGDQIKNAESYQKRGLARVLPQENMTPETMTAAVLELLENRETLRAAVEAYPVKDGTDAVLAMIEDVQTRRGHGR